MSIRKICFFFSSSFLLLNSFCLLLHRRHCHKTSSLTHYVVCNIVLMMKTQDLNNCSDTQVFYLYKNLLFLLGICQLKTCHVVFQKWFSWLLHVSKLYFITAVRTVKIKSENVTRNRYIVKMMIGLSDIL